MSSEVINKFSTAGKTRQNDVPRKPGLCTSKPKHRTDRIKRKVGAFAGGQCTYRCRDS
jgi:hypothetical protein